jgi:hypothetical protein
MVIAQTVDDTLFVKEYTTIPGHTQTYLLLHWLWITWLFQKIKFVLNGQRFQYTEDVQKNVTRALKAIPQKEF